MPTGKLTSKPLFKGRSAKGDNYIGLQIDNTNYNYFISKELDEGEQYNIQEKLMNLEIGREITFTLKNSNHNALETIELLPKATNNQTKAVFKGESDMEKCAKINQKGNIICTGINQNLKIQEIQELLNLI